MLSFKTSEYGRALIRRREALRLFSYKDEKGVDTIGWGHTGPEAKPGSVITADRAEELFEQDLAEFEQAVCRLVKVQINQNQFDALVSFAYNCGIFALEESTLLRLLNAGDFAGAAGQFPRWDKAGHKQSDNLHRRRLLEQQLFLSVPRPIVSAA